MIWTMKRKKTSSTQKGDSHMDLCENGMSQRTTCTLGMHIKYNILVEWKIIKYY